MTRTAGVDAVLAEVVELDTTSACADLDPEIFFPLISGSAVEHAKRICRPCPVRIRCLQFALGQETGGVWGGTSERERRKALRTDPSDPVSAALRLADARSQPTEPAAPAPGRRGQHVSRRRLPSNR